MRTRPLRPLRLGLPAAAVIALALSGCSDPAPTEPAPAAPPASSTSSAPSAPSSVPAGGISADRSTTGSDGLTVRYLDGGTVKTVRVEDFPR